jgi:peptidoglycan/xylan/chitin deacetylase (PgdA/CDA1 family)
MIVRDRWRPAKAEVVPVLLFHSVDDAPPPGQVQRYTVSRSRFREHIEAITASGATSLTIPELAEALRGNRLLPERAISITFDDGFDDTVDAVGALREVGLSSTVYVTTGNIDTPMGISVSGLGDLIAAGAEVGAHTVSHPHLDEIDPQEAAVEIRDSRAQLETRLGLRVTTFAYPHGAYDRRVRAAVIAAGFGSAAGVRNAFSHRLDDPFAIARWTVRHDTSPATLAEFVEGHGAPIAWRNERYRTRAYRKVRYLRRRIGSLRTNRSP